MNKKLFKEYLKDQWGSDDIYEVFEGLTFSEAFNALADAFIKWVDTKDD